ncbi:preATP grasp domain-containing protein [Streptomyces physcomitrii]|uniref:ATP-grasp domain-containing protein n=1 Tax=Streptomyces physcomitrii TaxID=2724184 RepID=A0ABX1H3N9_9ACTN|nr:ATP-grasp domain-containing protein [Streptomyces physcomitrii]NKI42977.1 ATP-grasp domain-containing protein [Streptomyces physcomitrii]
MSSYLRTMKESVSGDPNAVFVFLCNFEVERRWAQSYTGLPGPQVSGSDETVQRLEELGALLGAEGDYLLLRSPLDPGFRAYAEGLGLAPPSELVPENFPEGASTSAAVLGSPVLLDRLRALGRAGAHLMPMGTSADEQKIAEITGLRLAGADADRAEKVNSKIYSRRITEQLGLRTIPGACCESVDELARALDTGLAAAPAVIVKEAYGVSGRGLIVLRGRTQADRLLRMVRRRAERTGSDRLDVVVEHFLPKRADLNYQFTVGRDGGVHFDFVKEALTENGIHKGHLMPSRLDREQIADLEKTSLALGRRLFEDGFFGVVGVDALLGEDSLVYPVLEINARLNMSSYQGRATEALSRPGGVVLAKHYPLRLERPLTFTEIHEALQGFHRTGTEDTGILLTCFATVNAQAAAATGPFDGRLYTLLFAPDRERLGKLDHGVTERLGALTARKGNPR